MGITRFNAGDGYAHYVGKDGVSLEILPQAQGIVHPFKIKAFKKNGALKATVRAGTANNLVPILDGDDMDIVPPPELTLTDNATNRIYLKAEKGGSTVFFPDILKYALVALAFLAFCPDFLSRWATLCDYHHDLIHLTEGTKK